MSDSLDRRAVLLGLLGVQIARSQGNTSPWLPANFTRAPFRLGCRPSPASITPAFTSSSLNLPMSARSFWSGMTPASESSVARTITMKRMSVSLGGPRARPPSGRAS